MKSLIFSVFIFINAVFLFSCHYGADTKTGVADSKKAVQAQKQDTGATFTCSPDTLYPGGKISVTLPNSHIFKEMAIESPGKARYYIHFPPDILLMPAEDFRKASKLEIPQNITSLIYQNGKPARKPVFTIPGKYRLILADNLETEEENSANLSCFVYYCSSVRK